MPDPKTYAAPTNIVPVSIEGRSESNTLHIRGHASTSGVENVLTGAGLVAIVATLSSYYSGLSAANMTKLVAATNGVLLNVTTANITAAVLAADHVTVAASLTTNVRASGNSGRG